MINEYIKMINYTDNVIANTITRIIAFLWQCILTLCYVSQHKKDRVRGCWGPSCWCVTQSAPQGNPAPSHSASSPAQPSQGLAWAAYPSLQTSWVGCALYVPNCHLKRHRDPECHEVWPVIAKLHESVKVKLNSWYVYEIKLISSFACKYSDVRKKVHHLSISKVLLIWK